MNNGSDETFACRLSIERDKAYTNTHATAYTGFSRNTIQKNQPASQMFTTKRITFIYQAITNGSTFVTRLNTYKSIGNNGGHHVSRLPFKSTKPRPASILSTVDRFRTASDETPAPYLHVAITIIAKPSKHRLPRYH